MSLPKIILFPNAKCYVFVLFLTILEHFGTKAFKKPVAPAGYKNKQTVSRRRYLARVLSSLMYRYALRQSASVSRFLYPAKGYGDLKTDSLTNFQVTHDTLPKAVLRKQRSLCAAGTFSHRT